MYKKLYALPIKAMGLLAALSTTGLASTPEAPTSPLSCTKAIYRLSPPGIAAAVYFDLKNVSAAKVELVSATSDVSKRIEIHKSGMENGMMMMESVEQLALGAGQTISFKPGGYHLMVFVPKDGLAEGDTVPFTLTTKSGTTSVCKTTVKKHFKE